MKKRSKKFLASMVVCGLLAAPVQAIAESVPVGFTRMSYLSLFMPMAPM